MTKSPRRCACFLTIPSRCRKEQARPEYDQTFLIAPPAEDAEAEPEEGNAEQDPMYDEALRVVLGLR